MTIVRRVVVAAILFAAVVVNGTGAAVDSTRSRVKSLWREVRPWADVLGTLLLCALLLAVSVLVFFDLVHQAALEDARMFDRMCTAHGKLVAPERVPVDQLAWWQGRCADFRAVQP